MKKATINHKRITAIVRQEVQSAINKAREYEEEKQRHPDSELAVILKRGVISGIEFNNVGNIGMVFITINEEFLNLVGYVNNLNGFLADYFGSDFEPAEKEPLKFRFLGGYLVNPTRIKK